ncbi:ABC transporter permease [Caenibacillus caldisaponilyticus]|jgi:peptide/nickel transport system permease protein|uniref:ABC transporter permease n=1 Tax=Caenibacillus caldisaponilyticus TaxID=1674942 RepID=UPI00098833D7|nr:ABC transporter permease [Caenibacillus caldisaponilyticus]
MSQTNAQTAAPYPNRLESSPRLRSLKKALGRFFQNKLGVAGGLFLLILVILAIFAPWLAPYNPMKQDYMAILQGPSAKHWFGTDDLGRDVLSRIIYGARVSLKAGIISVAIALAIGVPIGLISGYFRGFWDEFIIMRITDAMLSFPSLVLALTLAAVFGAGLNNAMLAIGLVYTPHFIRLVRGQVLAQREREYVEAAIAAGISHWRIMLRHILPNAWAPIMVQATLSVAGAIISEASLSFLGLGTQPPTPSWGSMLSEGQGYITQAPWIAVFPGLFIFLAVMSINVFGDGVRDMLDPKLK